MRILAIVTLVGLAAAGASASADPAIGHVITAPTAWVPEENVLLASAGVDHRGDSSVAVGYGLGGIAVVDVGGDTDVRACQQPPCGTDNRATPMWLGRASFKIGSHQDALFPGQPAVALGVRATFTAHQQPGFADPRVSEAYLVASRELGPYLRVHAGAEAIDARFRDPEGAEHTLGTILRPIGGIELRPPQYPRTTLIGDVAWVPRLEHDAPTLEWLGGVSVRYQALVWGSIELTFRHREDEGLAASTVLVRVNAVFDHWVPRTVRYSSRHGGVE